MPKKFAGENTKAVAAKERKKNAKQNEISLAGHDEDDGWTENDKQATKRKQKKEKEQNRRQEQLQKKSEVKALLEAEMKCIAPTKLSKLPKISRAQIEKTITPDKQKQQSENTVEENFNRLSLGGEQARNVDEAISILNSKSDVDKHPEKRMKAAHLAYQEKRLKELKEENPSLRLSKLKEMVFKEWQNHPDNPVNKARK